MFSPFFQMHPLHLYTVILPGYSRFLQAELHFVQFRFTTVDCIYALYKNDAPCYQDNQTTPNKYGEDGDF